MFSSDFLSLNSKLFKFKITFDFSGGQDSSEHDLRPEVVDRHVDGNLSEIVLSDIESRLQILSIFLRNVFKSSNFYRVQQYSFLVGIFDALQNILKEESS